MTDPSGQPRRALLQALFLEAIDLSAADRQHFITARCAGDAALREDLTRLFSADERAGAFMTAPTIDSRREELAPSRSAMDVPTQIGCYKLLNVIGEGGFGTVYLAEQEAPVRRRLALKLIKLGMDSKQVIARFEAERQALAMMDHANIAKVFDAGATDSGRPYFAMEYVDGSPITQYCDQHELSLARRLELFVQVCRAVQHAHQKGLIHRDIKPTNILVTVQDEQPLPKVIDFGVAKATQARLTERTLVTELRQFIGTPAYMSPEQAEGNGDVDTRSDIYSLGVLLYELLTGTTPFSAKELRSGSFVEILQTIRDVEPPPPSARVSRHRGTINDVASQRQIESRKLASTLRGELDWISMKCLEKDRSRRYETVNSLALDILRYLGGEPVLAAPASRTYRVRKFVSRNRGPVIASMIVLIVLVAGIIGTTTGLIGESRQRIIAEQQRAEAQRQSAEAGNQAAIARTVSQFQSDMLASADPENLLGDKVTVLQAISSAVKELDAGKLKDRPLVEASVRNTIGNTLRALARYDLAEPNLRKGLELRRKALPAGHPDVAISLNDLALFLYVQGSVGEAESLYREALTIRRNAFPDGNALTAETLHNLAILLQQQRKLLEAESLYRESLQLKRKLLPLHTDTAATMHNLGNLLRATGRLNEAAPLIQEALDLRRKVLPPGHPAIAHCLGSLALLLQDQGKLDEVERLTSEQVRIYREALPADHPNLSTSVHALGTLLWRRGKLSEAEPMLREALEMRRKTLAAGHVNIARSLNNLGNLLKDRGEFAEAELVLREALEIYRKALPAGDAELAMALRNLGNVLWDEKKLDETEQMFRQALAIDRTAMPDGNAEIAAQLVSLGWLLSDQGKLAEAEALLREALAALERSPQPLGAEMGRCRLALGIALRRLNRYPEAVAQLLEAEPILFKSKAAFPTRYSKCVTALAQLYTRWDSSEPGKGYDAKAALWKAKLATTAPSTTQSFTRSYP